MECRFCHSKNLEMFLDLGLIPIVYRFLEECELKKPETFYPLNVYLCIDCGLAQLGYVIPSEILFNKDYPYDSRITKSRNKSYSRLAEFTCDKFQIQKNSLVVDIGSNTGLLLSCFKNQGMNVIGIEPSSKLAEIANLDELSTHVGFFDNDIVQKIISEFGTAKIVLATNVFAHIQDYDSFIQNLKKLLSNDGIFVIQVPHFLPLLNNLEYDTMYHEHVCYFGLKPLMTFFNKFDMDIFEVIEDPIDGGSIRCFIGKKGSKNISSNIEEILSKENEEQIYSLNRLKQFSSSVKMQKENLLNLLTTIKKENKKIVGIGAAAKGIALLSYCKIDHDILDFITEKDSLKIGKFTAGMHIPVKSDDVLIQEKPDYALILAWNFADEIMNNLDEYRKHGGKFIIPIPNPKIV